MKIDTVTDLLERSLDAVPEGFRGRIKKVFKQNTGAGKRGDWKLQKLIIVDDKNAEIEVLMDGRESVSRDAEGKQLYAQAVRGDKGLVGLKRTENLYNGKTTQQVKVFDRAEVSIEAGGSNGGQQSQGATQQRSNGSASSGSNSEQQKASSNGHSNGNANEKSAPTLSDQLVLMKCFDQALGRNCSALQRCLDAAFEVVRATDARHKDAGGFKPTHDGIKELGMGLYIQTCWAQKVGGLEGFPVKSFQDVLAKAKERGVETPAEPPKGCPF